MMAKPVRALELHYPMIQFLKISVIKSEFNSHHSIFCIFALRQTERDFMSFQTIH